MSVRYQTKATGSEDARFISICYLKCSYKYPKFRIPLQGRSYTQANSTSPLSTFGIEAYRSTGVWQGAAILQRIQLGYRWHTRSCLNWRAS